jgi:hypothetical protein
MKTFLSYSHKDKDFVDQLYRRLVEERIAVWMDRIELNVGDSLLDRIQTAITESGYLAVVLSKSFVKSEWCKTELNAGLVRELDGRRVVVLPILKEKCEIPPFLRSKLYADFRGSFEDGLDSLLRVFAAQTSQRIGRVDSPKYHTDFAYDFGQVDGQFVADLHAVSMAEGERYSVLANVHIVGGLPFSRRYTAALRAGIADVVAAEALGPCAAHLDDNSKRLLLRDDSWHALRVALGRAGEPPALALRVSCRRLGESTGHPLLYHYGSILGGAFAILDERRRHLSSSEVAVLAELPKWNAPVPEELTGANTQKKRRAKKAPKPR